MPTDEHARESEGANEPAPRQSRLSTGFEGAYAGTPPWDIGRPQAVFLALAYANLLRGRVLDVGCGTGEHALLAASHGLLATGIDAAPTAIQRAAGKARERKLAARFLVWDALALPELGEQFDTILDCGLFHVFDDEDRGSYSASLCSALVSGGRYYMLCFSDHQPGTCGPRRIRQEEIRACFADGWRVESIEVATLETNIDPDGANAWFSVISRL